MSDTTNAIHLSAVRIILDLSFFGSFRTLASSQVMLGLGDNHALVTYWLLPSVPFANLGVDFHMPALVQ